MSAKQAWERHYSRGKPALKAGQALRWAVVKVKGRKFVAELRAKDPDGSETDSS
jgi:hypothetical protein